jgi:GT2 family glycosyltransferase
MKYYAVIVTYGDRFRYLKQVVDSLVEQGVEKIVIISNGSDKMSLIKIKKLKSELNCIHLIILDKNTGSANGFCVGIDFAHKSNADFIWLLDDDNYPKKDALNFLTEAWIDLAKEFENKKLALLSYRNDRKIYSDAINLGKPNLMLGSQNSFLGFDFFIRLKKTLFKTTTKVLTKDQGVVAVAPYGGLFFHKDLVTEIGLPDKSYFLYGDDYEYTFRITKNNGKIVLIMKSEIKDLEKSFHLIKKGGILNTRYFNTESKDRIFYSVRNGIIFEQNFVSNLLIYILNSFIYLTLVFVLMLLKPKQMWKFKYIIKGIFSAIKKSNDNL